MKVGRRALLAGGAAAALASSGVYYSVEVEPHWLQVTRRSMTLPGLPPDWQGRTVVQISDLHAGARVDQDYLFRALDVARDLDPDIVLLTGDLIDSRESLPSHAERVLARVPRGRIATLGCLGNHDWGGGWQDGATADRVTGIAAEHGLIILRNEAVELDGLRIVGLDDLWSGALMPDRVLARSRPGAPTIVMCHNPDGCDEPGWGGFDGWVLSGHTHGGQVHPPFLPPPIVPVRNKRYVAGAYELAGNRRLYISRGVGHTVQVRFNARPEIIEFTLRAA